MFGTSPHLQSVMSHNFGRISPPRLQRSVIKMPFGHKWDMNEGTLYPWFVQEVLPGDTMKTNASMVARLATLIMPIMDNIFFDMFWFFCPNRLIWDNWERFQGYRPTPESSVDFEIPEIRHSSATPTAAMNFALGSIYDAMGCPILINLPYEDGPISLPMRAYYRIWNDWFRNPDVQDELTVPTDDGPDYIAEFNLQSRNKRHDYFASCLTSPQRGSPVLLPLGTSAPVIGDGLTLGFIDGSNNKAGISSIGTSVGNLRTQIETYGDPVGTSYGANTDSLLDTYSIGITTELGMSGMIVDLNNAVGPTINAMREMIVLQQILELDSRGGTRYSESLKVRWGVDAEDYRLQRPEYLGGSSERVGIFPVPQTSDKIEGGTAQGNLSAYGLLTSYSNFFKTFKEHGFVIGIANIRADQNYQEGMRKMWSRRTRADMYEPLAANLGEQAVLKKELVCGTNTTTNNEVFGYQERWSEYRYMPNLITGNMRSMSTTPLDVWHLAVDFNSVCPTLEDFMVDAPPIARVVAVSEGVDAYIRHFNVDAYAVTNHARVMPTYSIPGLDRF